jgi:hypothetical protein
VRGLQGRGKLELSPEQRQFLSGCGLRDILPWPSLALDLYIAQDPQANATFTFRATWSPTELATALATQRQRFGNHR